MTDDEAWRTERSFWLEGIERFEEGLGRGCIMAFPDPVGILSGDVVLRSLAEAPRWARVAISGQVLARPDATTCILGYRADARRSSGAPYSAYCTSTYRNGEAGWKLVQHQQTPTA